MPVALVRSLAATRRRRRPAAGSLASPCRSTLIYKPRPEGALTHYCLAHSSRPGPVTSGRPLPRRFLPFHRRSPTVRRATSGARGPAGRSRSAGGAVLASFVFSGCPFLVLRCPTGAGAEYVTCEVFLRYGDAVRGHNGTESGLALRSRRPRVLRRRLHFTTPRATPLRSLLFSDLGARRPKEAQQAGRRAICCLTYARNADAALLSHSHIISKAPHYCTAKAPQR